MSAYRKVYDFAAGAGALEGYVYHKESLTASELTVWVGRLEAQYKALPAEIVAEFQDLCDKTVGRAIGSIAPLMGDDHALVARLRSLTKGALPKGPDDFEKTHE